MCQVPAGYGVRVLVLVVRVVGVEMRVLHGEMGVLVLVALGEVEPDTQRHQRAAARASDQVIGSPIATETTAPTNGATAK